MPAALKRTRAMVSWQGIPENITTRNATVRINREMVRLFGKFIQPQQVADCLPRVQESLNLFCQQIVVGVPNNFHAREFPERQLASNVNAPIDIRRIGLPARNEKAPLEIRCVLLFTADETVFPGTNARALYFLSTRLFFNQ